MISRQISPSIRIAVSTFRLTIALIAGLVVTSAGPATGDESVSDSRSPATYGELVAADQPTAYWNFDLAASNAANRLVAPAIGRSEFSARVHGAIRFGVCGPRPASFPLFHSSNTAIDLVDSKSFLVVSDPGTKSSLDFGLGDVITIEAWVEPRTLDGAAFFHIVQKGRTGNANYTPHNQNYALRLKSPTGQLSFLFRSDGEQGAWHRWTSNAAVGLGDGWHHVVVSYRFGYPKSIQAYIDAEATRGKWDMAGATEQAPVVDNDDLRIGATFQGKLDEVAIYRHALDQDRVQAHYKYAAPNIESELAGRL